LGQTRLQLRPDRKARSQQPESLFQSTGAPVRPRAILLAPSWQFRGKIEHPYKHSEHAAALVAMARTIHQTFVALEKSNQYDRYIC
jgi:hypothetical protein